MASENTLKEYRKYVNPHKEKNYFDYLREAGYTNSLIKSIRSHKYGTIDTEDWEIIRNYQLTNANN